VRTRGLGNLGKLTRQATIRNGRLNLVLLRYTFESAGGPIDGLVINNLDQLADVSPEICTGYSTPSDAEIHRLSVSMAPSLAAQEKLTALLDTAVPICQQETIATLCDTLAREIAPIAITGTGPVGQHRTLHDLQFRCRNQSATSVEGIVAIATNYNT
jgi:hypothetical protein